MPRLSVMERVERYNAGRETQRLALKYEAMRKNAFAFMRGTCHLFHEDWRAQPVLDRTPRAWISGDLHLENFGSYKGDNRLAYFDLNDFDEATLAPVARDLARFLTSVFVAARSLGLKERATTERDRVVQEMFKRGVLILGAGRNAIRFAPPLVISKAQADVAVKIFDEVLTAL